MVQMEGPVDSTPSAAEKESTSASSPSFACKESNRQVAFTPVNDQIIVTFNESIALEAIEALWRREDSSVDCVSLNHGFAVLSVRDAEQTISLLRLQIQTEDALPVYRDQHGERRYFLPNEITIQFKPGVTAEQIQLVLEDAQLKCHTEHRTSGYYTVRLSSEGDDIFRAINSVSMAPEVAFAEPSEVGFNNLLNEADDSDCDTIICESFSSGTAESGFKRWVDNISEQVVGTPLYFEEHDESTPASAFLPNQENTQRINPLQWALDNNGQEVSGVTGIADADINATMAWDIETGSRETVVAVIDTGGDINHPDLKPAMVSPLFEDRLGDNYRDWDFRSDPQVEPWPVDHRADDNHATHIMGIIAAQKRNQIGMQGIAPGVSILPLRVNLTSGKQQEKVDAIRYVVELAKLHRGTFRFIINCSWALNGDHTGVRLAIQEAWNHNVVVVVAAGNRHQNLDRQPSFPASYPEVIAVAATDQRDQVAAFSNYGQRVNITAPGVNIYSCSVRGSYEIKDGTSVAAPHVSAIAALVWSHNRNLTNQQVRQCLEASCDNVDLQNPRHTGLLGGGRVNAYRALRFCPEPEISVQLLKAIPFPQKSAGVSVGLSYVPSFPFRFQGRRDALLLLTQAAGSERVFFLHPDAGEVLGSIDPIGANTISCLAWDGAAIRVAHVTDGAGSISRINAYNGCPISSIPAPQGRSGGIVVVGSHLFYATSHQIHELSAVSGAQIRSFPVPGGECVGLAYGRGYLFCASARTGQITVFNPWLKSIKGVITLPNGAGNTISGLCFDEGRRKLYVANQNESKIYVLHVDI